ncbi:MAG: hypothetical protein JWN04_5877 [Myxococcaceae bacterium]|nr:hypothetical protein [Myxococcaceae bacterium]
MLDGRHHVELAVDDLFRTLGASIEIRCSRFLGALSDLMPLSTTFWGSSNGGMDAPLYTRPVISGQSGSPFKKLIKTSWPVRGTCSAPQPLPAHNCATRTHHELFSLDSTSRSR